MGLVSAKGSQDTRLGLSIVPIVSVLQLPERNKNPRDHRRHCRREVVAKQRASRYAGSLTNARSRATLARVPSPVRSSVMARTVRATAITDIAAGNPDTVVSFVPPKDQESPSGRRNRAGEIGCSTRRLFNR